MFRFFVVPMIAGVLVFLGTWFVSPLVFSSSGVVSILGDAVVNYSNSRFETMPPVIASYVANLNLVLAALTLGLMVVVMIQLLLVAWSMIAVSGKWLIACLRKPEKEEEPRDLPPLEMDPRFRASKIGKGVMGRGLDSIDQN